MPDIVLPEASPPMLAPYAREKVADEILGYGLRSLWDVAVQDFRKRQPILYLYVKNFNVVDDGGDILLDDRPRNVLRTAAIITERAYVAGGVEVSIDDFDKFSLACLEAKLTGIPEAYILKAVADLELQSLLDAMRDTVELQNGAEEYGGYEQFVAIGAGITRHFLQYELAA